MCFFFQNSVYWTSRPGPTRMDKTQTLHTEPHIDYSDAQVPLSDNAFYVDPEYPADLSA